MFTFYSVAQQTRAFLPSYSRRHRGPSHLNRRIPALRVSRNPAHGR
ncbi:MULTISPECIES: hypothetical protein [unclassified Arthrobacter]|nr:MULTISPECIES: hypothetical protein [unclassified Arthrobacter]